MELTTLFIGPLEAARLGGRIIDVIATDTALCYGILKALVGKPSFSACSIEAWRVVCWV